MHELLLQSATETERSAHHAVVFEALQAMLADETDWICALATVACELHEAFDYFDWTGFYRLLEPQTLVIGPYQGSHGCLRIDLNRGVCGAAARARQTQRVDDVTAFPGHIACSTTTRSELVVPILTPSGTLLGVLDVDSELPAAFSQADQDALEALCAWLGARFAPR
ncbi:MAG: diguanylate phosphodiesterase [Deltaproteobacteria bacterium CG2_30_63_29]|nr:MAG: diguanylate phosphodiesterase [Deltaproteobacteria bacterium CG2_30_63_29]PJB43381.1 MAG: diguanylate phosphodiesterase [Deltaproteobacteria bacterium CG_4_9_14_3_um_filter_63_12]